MSKGKYNMSKGKYNMSKGKYDMSKGKYNMSKGKYRFKLKRGNIICQRGYIICQRGYMICQRGHKGANLKGEVLWEISLSQALLSALSLVIQYVFIGSKSVTCFWGCVALLYFR